MSRNYDSGMNSAHARPNAREGGRSIEYSEGSATYIWVWVDAASVMWYGQGEDDSWSATQLSGAGPAGELDHNVSVGEVAIAIDHVDDHVHIAYTDTTNDQVYHAECTDPPNPDNAKWTVFGANAYQRCDNTANVKSAVSIAVDSATGGGNQSPFVIWQEAGTSIRFNCSIVGTHVMGNPLTLANTPGETSPTIIVAEDEGREPYAFWIDAAGTGIECMKVVDPADPQVLGNWGGPAAGAGGGVDAAITPGGFDTAVSAPSATWWWDADERVTVAAVLTGGGGTNAMVTNQWDETAGPAAWLGQTTSSTPGFGTPAGCMLVNRGNTDNWTAYNFDNATHLEYALKDNGYSFAGRTWYDQATTSPSAGSYMSCEWRHLEIISAGHSVVVWENANNLWYGETRINVAPTVAAVSPVGGEYHDELGTITFEWNVTDTDGDSQRAYYVEIDDDVGFGSPVADPGSNLRLNTWTTDGAETGVLNASVLTADTTYYWRVKVRDDEFGTEYDPNSEGGFGSSETLKTTPPFTMNITSVSQKADKSAEIDFWLNLNAGVSWNEDVEVTVYEYDDNGGYGALTLDAAYHAPPGEPPANIVITGGTEYFTLGWHAHLDVEPPGDTYDDTTIDVRLTARYTGDAHSLGNVVDTQANVALDFKSPDSVALGTPEGGTVTIQKPTLNVSASDTNGWEMDISVYHDAGYYVLLENSGYQGLGVTSWKMTKDFTRDGVWYWEVTTRDGSASQNEDPTPTQGSFTYSPPPDPTECFDGSWTLEIEPNREWDGDEFDLVQMDDLIGSVMLTEGHNSPNRLDFVVNNARGKYLDPSSPYHIPKGSEVRLEKGNKRFYGIIKTMGGETLENRVATIYCESFISFAESMPIQLRVVPTASSGLYWEDYIKKGLAASGLVPKWFRLVDGSGNEIYAGDSDNMTPVSTGSEIVYDKVSPVEFLNDAAARTGKIWYEGGIPEVGRKTLLYWTGSPNTNDASADHTFYIESDVLYEALEHDFDSLINRVIFTDANVMEQDMDSIREYGVFVLYQKSRGVEDKERLIEIAQYILEERSQPMASGRIKLFDEVSVSPNQVVRIYEEDTYDAKSGFSGKYVVTGVVTKIGDVTTTEISITNRWENPFIRDLLEALKDTARSDEPLVILRGETAEVRAECIDDGVELGSESTYTSARLGMDRYSDEDTDADYYSTYGWY